MASAAEGTDATTEATTEEIAATTDATTEGSVAERLHGLHASLEGQGLILDVGFAAMKAKILGPSTDPPATSCFD